MVPNAAAGIALAQGFIGGLPGLGGKLDLNLLRPVFDPRDGGSYVIVNGRKLKTNAVASLQYQEWLDIDRSVLEAYFATTQAVEDLRSAGLTHPLGSVGKTISLYDKESDMTPASVNMSGITLGEEDRAAYNTASVPVPVFLKPFRLNWRHLAASRSEGEALDTANSRLAGRKVAEAEENVLINGSTEINVEGAVIYGYRTHPDRNLVDMGVDWSTATGAQIVGDVMEAVQSLRTDFRRGPYKLYIPLAYATRMDADYNPGTSDTRTIRERILAIEGVASITVLDHLAAPDVLLVQLDKQTVDWAVGQTISTINWQEMGGLQNHFYTLSVGTPRVKSDYDGRSGIVHITPIPS